MSKRKQSEDSRSKGDKKHKATNGIAPGMVGFLIMADRGTTQKALNEAISFFEEVGVSAWIINYQFLYCGSTSQEFIPK